MTCPKCDGSGKNALGGNFRNFSHLYEQLPDGTVVYFNASKAEKPVVLAFLRRPHVGEWFAAIADSGQKHVLPWAPINPPGAPGRVLFDETMVTLPGERGWQLVDDMRALLTAGATKDEIARGDYQARAWMLCREEIERFEEQHAGGRGGGWFDLALWLAQRDEETVQARLAEERRARETIKARRKTNDVTHHSRATRAPGRGHRKGAARPASDVSRGRWQSATALGSDAGPGTGGDPHNNQCE